MRIAAQPVDDAAPHPSDRAPHMDVVALPGRHAQTELWLRTLLSAVPLSDERLVRYRHWSTTAEASIEFEAGRLAGLASELVVAKSFGTAVAIAAFHFHEFRPRAAVFIGTPFVGHDQDALSKMRQFTDGVRTLFIQQTADPGGSAPALAQTLGPQRAKVAEVPGSDHLYTDTELVASHIRAWLRN